MGGIFSRQTGEDDKSEEVNVPGMEEWQLEELKKDQDTVKSLRFGHDEPMYKTIQNKEGKKVTDLITDKDITPQNKYLQQIFRGEGKEALNTLALMRVDQHFDMDYEHDLLLAFWLAIHKEDITVARNLIDWDPSLRYMATLAFHGKRELIPQNQDVLRAREEKRAQEEEQKKKKDQLKGIDEKASENTPSKVPPSSKNPGSDKPQMEGGRSTIEQEDSDEDSGEDDGEGDNSDSSNQKKSQVNDEWGQNDDDDDTVEEELESDQEEDPKTPQKKKEEIDRKTQSIRPPYILYEPGMYDYLQSKGLSGYEIELTKIETVQQIQKIKAGFQLRFPRWMAIITQILLFKEEIPLACFLTAYYEVDIDKEMYVEAIYSDHYDWLKYVWNFNKNFIGNRRFYKYENCRKKSKDNEEQPIVEKVKFLDLFGMINILNKEGKDGRKRTKNEEKKNHIENFKTYDFQEICEWMQVLITEKEEEKEPNIDQDTEFPLNEVPRENDNILFALLGQMSDQLALDYMGYYSQYLNRELFLEALKNGNQEFIKRSLIQGAFDKQYFKDKEVVEFIIEQMKDGFKTNQMLNTLILIDINTWMNNQIADLLSEFETFLKSDIYDNRLILSNNPLMSITLTCELLDKIAGDRKRFENACNGMKESLLELGRVFNSKIDIEDNFEKLIMDVDFQNRSVLKIISECKFGPLMAEDDPKPENIMNNIYVGKGATKCDGNIYGYSTFMHILTTPIASSNVSNLMEMITNNFHYITNLDYSFQHCYRSRAINIFFMKEMVFGLVMLGLTYRIFYFNYIIEFRGKNTYILPVGWYPGIKYDENNPPTQFYVCNNDDKPCYGNGAYDFQSMVLTIKNNLTLTFDRNQTNFYQSEKLQEEQLKANMENFQGLFLQQIFVSGLLIFQLVLRNIFNLFKDDNVNMLTPDMFLRMDLMYSGVQAIVFSVITAQDPKSFLDQNFKDMIDILVVIVLILGLLRFFMLFFVVPSTSKMILTIIGMLIDVKEFSYIMFCYMIMASQMFACLYQDINPDSYGGSSKATLYNSFRKIYEHMLGSYDYVGAGGDQEIIYTCLIILNLFFLNILLLNYMIAILSGTYGDMLEEGGFLYKTMLFKYCERYMIAFKEKNLGEMVIHASPMNLFAILLIPFTPFKDFGKGNTMYGIKAEEQGLMQFLCEKFALANFWFENIFFMIGFVMLEMTLFPFVFLKTYQNIIATTKNFFRIIFYLIAWTVLGPVFVLPFLIMRDCGTLLQILYYHNGCKKDNPDPLDDKKESKDEDNELREDDQIIVYNNIRECVYRMYITEKRLILFSKGGEPPEISNEQISADMLRIMNILKEDVVVQHQGKCIYPANAPQFKMKLVSIHDEYRKMLSTEIENNKKDKKKGDIPKTEDEAEKSPDEAKKEEVASPSPTKGGQPKELTEQDKQKLIYAGPTVLDKDNRQYLIYTAFIDGAVNEQDNDEDDEDDNQDDDEKDYKMKDNFAKSLLEKFLVQSNSAFLDTIDTVLMMKAIPNLIAKEYLNQQKLYDFSVFQNSLIAFSNAEIIDAFQYYDNKNQERVTDIKNVILQQKEDLQSVQTIMNSIQDCTAENQKIEKAFNELWADFKHEDDQNKVSQQEDLKAKLGEGMKRMGKQKTKVGKKK